MKPEQAQRLRDILLMLGTLIMFSSYLFGQALLWVGMVITFSGLIPHFLYNKCPHCGRAEEEVSFERIRRITGYLVGTLDRFNNAKRAEERDRVKHVI